eukprot:364378-Chlamydomonas_euryale.AAC.2
MHWSTCIEAHASKHMHGSMHATCTEAHALKHRLHAMLDAHAHAMRVAPRIPIRAQTVDAATR